MTYCLPGPQVPAFMASSALWEKFSHQHPKR
eukprot:CAMPEP_0115512018 /NCGR_PEP_ID=MMETSP0271-20121206/74277_1 /TAXON_ID=71861 /ORGANISM="Scrippsiella trochoidea, Strain CCMP3099" /LENGTH=30 /DNA_ID= /DNA_START= /DNA_END= /DNA_ORIENTATION=